MVGLAAMAGSAGEPDDEPTLEERLQDALSFLTFLGYDESGERIKPLRTWEVTWQDGNTVVVEAEHMQHASDSSSIFTSGTRDVVAVLAWGSWRLIREVEPPVDAPPLPVRDSAIGEDVARVVHVLTEARLSGTTNDMTLARAIVSALQQP